MWQINQETFDDIEFDCWLNDFVEFFLDATRIVKEVNKQGITLQMLNDGFLVDSKNFYDALELNFIMWVN